MMGDDGWRWMMDDDSFLWMMDDAGSPIPTDSKRIEAIIHENYFSTQGVPRLHGQQQVFQLVVVKALKAQLVVLLLFRNNIN